MHELVRGSRTERRPIKELPAVGAERALRIIAGRWKLVLVWSLLERPRRLRDLERLLPEARQKVLLDQLRELEAHGLVVRSVEPGPPVLVTYEATPLGRSLRPLVLDLCAWGRRHARATDSRR
jgi:DNA-binding HxlR family transcriptional regulator